MRSWFLLLLLAGYFSLSKAQTHITTEPLRDQVDAEMVQRYRWRLQGKEMHWGETLEATPSQGKFDTLYFDEGRGRGWDTILCLIPDSGHFTFVFNTCCGGFYVRSEVENRFPEFEVEFVRKGAPPKGRYMGELGSAGYLLGRAKRVSAKTTCNSVMQSNITWVGLQPIPMVTKHIPENSWICLFDENGNEYEGEPLEYRDGASKGILFAPFQSGKLTVTWQASNAELGFGFQPMP